MTLKELAQMLDGREYRNEITKEEEALAKELGFVVVFGYSDDNAELRGAIDDEIGCFDGGILEHDDLPEMIYAMWCPEYVDCAWAYQTSIPHEKFHIYDHGELYCVGIVCDINKPKQTNADRIGRYDGICNQGYCGMAQTACGRRTTMRLTYFALMFSTAALVFNIIMLLSKLL